MAHLSVKHFSAFRNSFSPSRRHWRHFASRFLAKIHSLDTTLFRRTAAVMRHWRNVRNAGDFETGGVQRAHCGFATGAGALDANLQVLDATLDGRFAHRFGS